MRVKSIGTRLVMIMGLALAMVPVMLFPIFNRFNEVLALGSVVFRGVLETRRLPSLGHQLAAAGDTERGYATATGRGFRFSSPEHSRAGDGQVEWPCPVDRFQPGRSDDLLPVLSTKTHASLGVDLGAGWSRPVPH